MWKQIFSMKHTPFTEKRAFSGKTACLCVFLFLSLFPQILFCERSCGADSKEAALTEDVKEQEWGFSLGAWLASFFSKHISPVDGSRCPSEPSCSAYSAKAFRKHGFVMGWLMTVDRLIHESDEDMISPVVVRDGKGKILDPVENNDFWWHSEKRAVEER